MLPGLGSPRAVRVLQLLEADGGVRLPSGDELVDRAGVERVVVLVVIAACARFPLVRRGGLCPDYRRGPVRAGELPPARRAWKTDLTLQHGFHVDMY